MLRGNKLEGSTSMITIFYDGKCGACSREILYYQKKVPHNAFLWKDVIESADELVILNVSVTQALMALHAIDNGNQIQVGIDAFILIWTEIRGWRILAKIISFPVIKPLSILAYNKFAKVRFSRSTNCKNLE